MVDAFLPQDLPGLGGQGRNESADRLCRGALGPRLGRIVLVWTKLRF